MKTKVTDYFHTETNYYYKTKKGYCFRYNKVREVAERISLKEYEEQRALAKQKHDDYMAKVNERAKTHKMSESYYKQYGEGGK